MRKSRGVIKRQEVGIFPFYSGLIPCHILEICIGVVWKTYEIPHLLCLDPRVPKMLMKPLKICNKTHHQYERFTFVRQKTIKIAFFLTVSRVSNNILQTLTLTGSGKCAMAFTRQKYFTPVLASWGELLSIPDLGHS